MSQEKKEVERLQREIGILQTTERQLRSSVNKLTIQIESMNEEVARLADYVVKQRDIANSINMETISLKKILSAQRQAIEDTKKLIQKELDEIAEKKAAMEKENERLEQLRTSVELQREHVSTREKALEERISWAETLEAANIKNATLLDDKTKLLEKQENELKAAQEDGRKVLALIEENQKKLDADVQLFERNKEAFFNESERVKYEIQELRKKKGKK